MKFKMVILLTTCMLLLYLVINLRVDALVRAQSGEIELLDADTSELIALKGEWAFYWNKLLLPEDIDNHQPTTMIPQPGLWSGYIYEEEKAFPKEGYGTLRLTLTLPESEIGKQKAIYIPSFYTAYKLYIDGVLVGEVGEVGKSKEEMKPKYLPSLFSFTPQAEKVDIIIQNSNFYHIKNGVMEEILYGDAEVVHTFKEKAVAKDGFLFGIFFLIGLYHLLYFFYRKHEYRSLTFSLFSFTIAFRTVIVGQVLFSRAFPDFNWILATKLEYLTVFLGFLLYAVFLKTLYPKEAISAIHRILLFITGICAIVVILTAPTIFTHLLKPFGFIAFLFLFYFMYVMIMAVAHKREGAVISCVTGTLFFITVLNDMLLYNGFIQTIDMVPFGFFIFLFSQYIMLTQEYAKSFNEQDRLNALLQKLNANLEDRIKVTKESLEQSMNETASALTEKMVLEERNRLIGEIHDTVGHTLTTIIVQIEAGKRLISSNPDLAKEKFESSQAQIRSGLNEIRKSLRVLKDNDPGSIEFIYSIRNLIYNTEKNADVTIKSEINVSKSLTSKQQALIYRALQEGLTNGIRHGKSNQFKVSIYDSEGWLTFKLEDNGEGIDDIQYGIGLSMMEERVKDLNGEIHLDSEKGKGFTIEICLPFY